LLPSGFEVYENKPQKPFILKINGTQIFEQKNKWLINTLRVPNNGFDLGIVLIIV